MKIGFIDENFDEFKASIEAEILLENGCEEVQLVSIGNVINFLEKNKSKNIDTVVFNDINYTMIGLDNLQALFEYLYNNSISVDFIKYRFMASGDKARLLINLLQQTSKNENQILSLLGRK